MAETVSTSYWPPGDPIEDENSFQEAHVPPESKNDPMFYALYLSQSLTDCSFGIHSWTQRPISHSKLQVTASVYLLDESNADITVALDKYGFFVQRRSVKSFFRRFGKRSNSTDPSMSNNDPTAQERRFGTLQDLLCSVSPIFTKKLERKLQEHSSRRQPTISSYTVASNTSKTSDSYTSVHPV